MVCDAGVLTAKNSTQRRDKIRLPVDAEIDNPSES